ncbi:MAG: hypothetical protein ACP5OO_05130 [Chloroflexia bacterium]
MRREHAAILLAVLFGLAVWGLDIVLELAGPGAAGRGEQAARRDRSS